MRIYTSYFKNRVNLQLKGIHTISIARKNPPGYKGDSIIELAPEWRMLKWTTDRYIPYYRAILSKLDPQQIFEKIKDLSGGRDVALLCYEPRGSFCHRQLVAEWLMRHGIPVMEYKES